jgi:hypothetical protein
MPDPFADYIRPGFPRPSSTDGGERVEIQYVGLASVLKDTVAEAGDRPVAGQAWGDYPGAVTVSEYEPLAGTDPEYGIVTIICELNYGGDSETIGTERETTYEIEWVNISRSLFEHPEFRNGGGGTYELDDQSLAEIRAWQDEPDTEQKALYKFWQRDKYGNPTGTLIVLTDPSAKKFAQYLSIGVENYDDYAPVARKSTTFTGGPPGDSEAGSMETPTGFPNLPVGWEWLKTADRALRAGGQTRWVRTEEWTGAKKVLVDNSALYFGAT